MKLKEGQSPAVLEGLARQFGVSGLHPLLPKRLTPAERLRELGRERAQMEGAKPHQDWYWWGDKDSKEFKEHEARIAREKENLDRRIADLERIVARAERMQAQGQSAPSLEGIQVLQIRESNQLLPLLAALNADPAVEYAEPDFIMRIQTFPDTLPNDTYVDPDQNGTWSTGAWGQSYDDLWGLKKIEAHRAWPVSQGVGVVVAVIDTGVDYAHSDLAQNIWINPGEDLNHNGVVDASDLNGEDDDGNRYFDDLRGWDFTSNPGDNDPMDLHGHGTHCSGTIAAVGNNAQGVIGVAPRARIMPVRGLDENGSGAISGLAAAVVYAAENGADVLSNSWGGRGSSQTLQAAFDFAHAQGCVSVVAAGNDAFDAQSYTPANIDKVITVAASTTGDQRASFSNFGLKIDVSAPGGDSGSMGGDTTGRHLFTNILSARAAGTDMYEGAPNYAPGAFVIGDAYYRSRGTSMACPHVAGVAALIRARYPAASPDEIRARLRLGCDSIESLLGDDAGLMGSGRINAFLALQVASQPYLIAERYYSLGDILPGAEIQMAARVRSLITARRVTLWLSASDSRVTVTQGQAGMGDLAAGVSADNAAQPFRVRLGTGLQPGDEVRFDLTGTDRNGSTVLQSRQAIRLKVGYFRDVTQARGISFTTDLYESNIDGTFADLNQDGFSDLINSPNLYLYNPATGRYQSSFTFARHWISRAADIDNDGDLDVAVTELGGRGLRLYQNNGPEGSPLFTDITEAAGLPDLGDTFDVVFLDYDNDGLPDMLIPNQITTYTPVYSVTRKVVLLRNVGNRRFEDVTARAGLGAAAAEFLDVIKTLDYDRDGFTDFFIAREQSDQTYFPFYRNRGNGSFELRDVGIPGMRVFSSAVGDVDNDGFPDIYLAHAASVVHHLYRNRGDRTFQEITANAFANCPKLDGGVLPWPSSQFLDYDNDGLLDLMVANSLGESRLLRNEGGASFSDHTDRGGLRGGGDYMTLADYNNDGYPDVLGLPQYGSPALMENNLGRRANPNHWLRIGLSGRWSNRFGLGARVQVTAGGVTQTRVVSASEEFAEYPLLFGLGTRTSADRIEVRWPSGRMSVVAGAGVSADRQITITESMPWQNPLNRWDVDANGLAQAADFLALNAELNRAGPRLLPAPTSSLGPPPWWDVNGDDWISPNDPLQVANHLNDPILSSIGNREVRAGQTLSFQVQGTDTDGCALTYTAPTLPFGAGFNAATRRFTWTPLSFQVGSHTARFEVGDGCKSDAEQITVTVLPNRPPVISWASGTPWVNGNGRVYFSAFASDPDGGALTYRWYLGDGNTRTGSSFWYRYAVSNRGWRYVTLRVTDSLGASASRSFWVYVR